MLSDRHLLTVQKDAPERAYSQPSIIQSFFYDLMSKRERQHLHKRAGAYYETSERGHPAGRIAFRAGGRILAGRAADRQQSHAADLPGPKQPPQPVARTPAGPTRLGADRCRAMRDAVSGQRRYLSYSRAI